MLHYMAIGRREKEEGRRRSHRRSWWAGCAHLKTRLWQVLSQGYGQSMALTGLRSKYQSPTDSAIFCNIENLINLEFNFHAFYCAESLTIQGNEMAESHETYTNSALNHGRRMSK